MTPGWPKCKFSWLYLFSIKSYRNFIISIVFYFFRHLWRHNPLNIDITVLIFCMQPHFTIISENFIFLASVEHTQKIGGPKVPPPHVWSWVKLTFQVSSANMVAKYWFLFLPFLYFSDLSADQSIKYSPLKSLSFLK